MTSTPTNVSYPLGVVHITPSSRQICGYNTERQDWIITPNPIRDKANGFRGHFCARFDRPFESYGIIQNNTHVDSDIRQAAGPLLSAYARFTPTEVERRAGELVVEVRVGTSFISKEQAEANLHDEVPDGTPLEETARDTREAWVNKLELVKVEGATEEQREVLYTGIFHTLQVNLEFWRSSIHFC